jgi:uncharacterized protein (TIGR02996 family)
VNYWEHEQWPNWVASIRADPEDDLPRLVAADWLDEQGYGERAELIRWGVAHPHQWTECEGDSSVGQPCPIHSEEFDNRCRFFCHSCQAFAAWGIPDLLLGEGSGTKYLRGFLHTVRASLINLIGSECGRCGGDGWKEVVADVIGGFSRYEREECHHCHGTGRVPGVLRELVRREPVTRVEVTDREPIQLWCDAGNVFHWMTGRVEPESPHFVPAEIHELITLPNAVIGGEEMPGKFATTADAARAALSDAILRWAMAPEAVTA